VSQEDWIGAKRETPESMAYAGLGVEEVSWKSRWAGGEDGQGHQRTRRHDHIRLPGLSTQPVCR
jgi:hypothetical protein